MTQERPDLSHASPEITTYIEALEAEIERLRPKKRSADPVEPAELPTTLNVITLTAGGLAKRTPRHLYGRQRRAGKGVFDLDVDGADPPALLTIADETDYFLLLTNVGRAFRIPVAKLPQSPVRARGRSVIEGLRFLPQEQIVAALPAQGGRYLLMVSERGWVQRVNHTFFDKGLLPGMSFHNPQQGGYVTGACWAPENTDGVFIATRDGKGIRFAAQQVPARGCLGLRVGMDDVTVAVTAVTDDSNVFLLTKNGKGTIRQMSSFRANKAPGAGAKVVMKTDSLVGAVTIVEDADLFIISQLGKLIRFQANEVPLKSGPVQGVNCLALRNDKATAVAL
jgi:DNA gyrase subunit A